MTKAEENTLYKITTNGTIEEVVLRDNQSNVISSGYVPSQIYNVDSNYVILVFTDPYLVRKTDGAVFSLSNVGVPVQIFGDGGNSGNTRKFIYNDSNGNVYYLSGGIVKKINVQNPDNITAQDYTPSVDSVSEFAVDSGGNLIYRGSEGANGVKRIHNIGHTAKNKIID